MYLTLANTAFSQMTLATLISKSILGKGRNREEIQQIKILLYQTILVFINYQYTDIIISIYKKID